MTGSARVSRLRLVADDEALVRRGAFLVEDALRVASIGARDDARLFIVRKLDLGTIDPDGTSQTLALAIEDRVKRLEHHAVPADAPEAASASVVVFPDEPTALARVVARLIAGPPPVEWYWRHVAGGIARQGSPAQVARACIAAALRAESAPLAVAMIVEAAERARSGELIKIIAPHEGAELIALTFGTALPALRAGEPEVAAEAALAALGPVWRERIARWVAHAGADARAVWFAAVALAHVRRSVIAPGRMLAEARAVVAEILRARAVLAEPAPPLPRAARALDAPPAGEQALPPVVDVRASAPEITATPEPIAAEVATAPSARERPPRRPASVLGDRTGAGGLLFLVRPLDRLGLPAWLERNPWTADRELPARLLADIARRCGAPEDDPLVEALAPGDASPLLPEHAWALAAWRRALAGWLRRRLDTTLRQLVSRPGLVRATRLHLDIDLPLSTVDLATRSAGLDINPGWVPWLGRVIAFGYRDVLA